ncbi:MAG: hypothetical protein ABIJ16_01550 [Bacteroidota bacterium]
MKKVLHTLIFVLFTGLTLFAQPEKGMFSAGGTISLSGSHLDQELRNSHSFGFELTPSAGYFFTSRLEAGIYPYINYSSSLLEMTDAVDNVYISSEKSHFYGGGIFLRAYLKLADKFYMTFDVTGCTGSLYKYEETSWSNVISSYSSEQKSSRTAFGGYIGLSYFVSPRVHIKTTLGNVTYSIAGGENQLTYDLYLNMNNVDFGVNFLF